MYTQRAGQIPDIEAGSTAKTMDQPFPEILCTEADDILLRQQIRQIDGDNVQRVAILSFRSLQLYRIAKLQGQLVRKQNHVMKTSDPIKETCPDSAISDSKSVHNSAQEEDMEVDELLQRYGRVNTPSVTPLSGRKTGWPVAYSTLSRCRSELRDLITKNRVQSRPHLRIPRREGYIPSYREDE